MTSSVSDGTGVLANDPWLEPFSEALRQRFSAYNSIKSAIEEHEGSMDLFTKGYQRMGINVLSDRTVYREWAPACTEAWFFGDFNNWNRRLHPMKKNEFGVFEITLEHVQGQPAVPHNSKVKICLKDQSGNEFDRIPAWIHRSFQPDGQIQYDGVHWHPREPYHFKHPTPVGPRKGGLRIYECHIGIASPDPKVASYLEFRDNVLPRVKRLGYNAIQVMAIMEHAYYGSFGYHVTNFFAASSRFGTPENLMSLIDTAHSMGITVIMDVVHSHASTNVNDGINNFDGTDHHYFHSGAKGSHELWDSRLFNYGHWEVLRFLLSNLRYWVEVFHFDGFRFDGVTSMLYHHHGLGTGFSGNYSDYFGADVDGEAVTYLMLANDMLHTLYPHIVTIAEDVSGMPTLCRPVGEGGIGFDYRMGMAIPDKYIELLKEQKDEEWKMGDIVHTLSNRRWKEWTVAYCESHDQALVGDKTLAFWLMDKEMYDFMSTLSPLTTIIDRGLALHKMLRLLTLGLGGEAYLTFMGNEFGHPEWIDFPREENGNDYHHARRRFDLADDDLLRYKLLENFDMAINHLEQASPFLQEVGGYVSRKHEGDKVIVFHRGDLLFVFNFHSSKSFPDYRVGCPWAGKLALVLDTDDDKFGGHSRNNKCAEFFTQNEHWDDQEHFVQLYLPSRTAQVYTLDSHRHIVEELEILHFK